MRPSSFFAQPADIVFFMSLKVGLEPFDAAVTLEGKDVRRQPVEEEAVAVLTTAQPAKFSTASSSAPSERLGFGRVG